MKTTNNLIHDDHFNVTPWISMDFYFDAANVSEIIIIQSRHWKSPEVRVVPNAMTTSERRQFFETYTMLFEHCCDYMERE